MTGYPQENFPAFNAAARALRLLGYTVVNPAEFTTDVTGLNRRARWVKFLKVDIKELMDCDCIVMLPDWEESEGAQLEHYNAKKLDITIFDMVGAVMHAPCNLVPEPAHA
jgi:hypothetical protein